MYERSAIVLERYFHELFGLNKVANVKNIYNIYKELVDEIENYQDAILKEEETIKEFDEMVNKIQRVQKEQTQIYNKNIKLEEERNNIFCSIPEKPEEILASIEKIENELEENTVKMKELKIQYIELSNQFLKIGEQRNIVSKNKRTFETIHYDLVKKAEQELENIDIEDIKKVKEFSCGKHEYVKKELEAKMIDNGKEEKIGFNLFVVQTAVLERKYVAIEETKCYSLIVERIKRLLNELNNNTLLIAKYKKISRDISAKMEFLEVKKNYIFSFLDNERLTVLKGLEVHSKLMQDSCEDFKTDMFQINKLYDLVLREISNKATKKAYVEEYNERYLKDIESNEEDIKEEMRSINVCMGTVINSNYWRIQEIRSIYMVFREIVTTKFERDLTEFEEKVPIIEITDEKIEEPLEEVKEKEIELQSSVEFEKDEYDEDFYEDSELEKKEAEMIIEDYKDREKTDFEIEEYDQNDEEYDQNDEEYDQNDEEYDDDLELRFDEDEDFQIDLGCYYDEDDEYEEDEEDEEDKEEMDEELDIDEIEEKGFLKKIFNKKNKK